MTPEPLTLDFDAPSPYLEPRNPERYGQHHLLLLALLDEGSRGLSGEEAALRCGISEKHVATTRLAEMSCETKLTDRFPVPLVAKSSTRERKTASGRRAYVFRLTDVGRVEAEALRKVAA